MRHPHADLIHAWAEGAEIEVFTIIGDEWVVTDAPTWDERLTYRIKSQETPWYEQIPEHGVLCWVSEYSPNPLAYDLLRVINEKTDRFIESNKCSWKFATPLTNDEIKQFLRGDHA